MREFSEDRFLFAATAKGQIKKTALSAYGNVRTGGIKGVKLADDDHLVGVAVTGGEDEIILATRQGQAIRFDESQARPMGRFTGGVSGINLADGDEVVGLVVREAGAEVLTVCENGCGKRTDFDEYRKTNRGGKGVININTERNGPVVTSVAVRANDKVILVSRGGMVVRTHVGDIRVTGRNASGVRVLNVADGDALVAMARCTDDEDEDDESAGDGATAPGGDAAPPVADAGTAPSSESPEWPTGDDDDPAPDGPNIADEF